ncbi:hypothetical protein ILYODFUR_000056 [Ilyodon furcidens]|uniref:Uncharacterized protein n=1 Tax=Ilyodon furcidens TaxID=33524 RepID=A0ABV0SWK9_9TELE
MHVSIKTDGQKILNKGCSGGKLVCTSALQEHIAMTLPCNRFVLLLSASCSALLSWHPIEDYEASGKKTGFPSKAAELIYERSLIEKQIFSEVLLFYFTIEFDVYTENK